MKGKALSDTKVSGAGGEEVILGTRIDTTLQLMMETLMRQVDPWHPVKGCSGADIQLQPMKDPTQAQVDVPESVGAATESLCYSRLLELRLLGEQTHTRAVCS